MWISAKTLEHVNRKGDCNVLREDWSCNKCDGRSRVPTIAKLSLGPILRTMRLALAIDLGRQLEEVVRLGGAGAHGNNSAKAVLSHITSVIILPRQ